MRQLIVRFLNVAVIAAVLIGYNTVLDKRDKEDQIARLSAELETTQLQKENLQAAAAAITSADGEDSAYLSNAEAIIPKIIEAQSADVDTISGATFSSTGIRNAAQEAIEKAEK